MTSIGTQADTGVARTKRRTQPTLHAPVTIVMYHYVRDLARSRYPKIRGLDLAHFREQLAYIRKHYTVITAESLVAAVKHREAGGHWELPRNSLLLTFDDGFSEHFRNVFPLLDEAGVQGSFFAPASAVIGRRVLDVNKIHFIMASVPGIRSVIADMYDLLDRYRTEYALPDNEQLYLQHANATRLDTADVIFVKRLLQAALPVPLRARILAELFARYVTVDEAAFAEELYAGLDELRCMSRHGMYIGSHGDTHQWLEHLTPAEQEVEVDRSLELLRYVGTPLDAWVMCYPYGSANTSLVEILRARGCALGLTTRVGISHASENPMLLSRLDTNDLPTQANAAISSWTLRVSQRRAK